MSDLVSGLVPILATPFAEDGALDLASLRRLTEFQLGCGVAGLAVFGMASEGFALTAAERRTILATVTELVAGAVPVVAGVNATSLVTALEQAREAVDGGADCLMVLPPYLAKPAPAQLVDFYGEVARASGCEVMVQDAPAATGVAMSAALLTELGKLRGVTSVKVEAQPTAPKVAEVVAGAPEGYAVIGGQNAFFLLEELDAGAVGTMPACEFSDLLGDVLAAYRRGDRSAAQTGYDRLLPLIRYGLQAGVAWAVHKEVLVRRGVIASATVRMPARPLDTATRRGLEPILAALALPQWRGA
ncbi:MAG: dihydrodipicolinate synthase family protein [Micromonosporaceae bacterium]